MARRDVVEEPKYKVIHHPEEWTYDELIEGVDLTARDAQAIQALRVGEQRECLDDIIVERIK